MSIFKKVSSAQQQPQRLRIGVFDDITCRLLTHNLDKGLQSAAVRRASVDEIRAGLTTGDLEVGLLPAWDFLQVNNLDAVPGCSVSTFGAGNIFMLFSKVLPTEIRRVLADHESFGARSAAHIMLPSQTGSRPEIIRSTTPLNPTEFDFIHDPHDAYLIVGENALLTNRSNFQWVWDLGQAWHGLYQAPYVVHLWCCRRGVEMKGIEKDLQSLAKQNASNPGEIVAREAERLKLKPDIIETLFRSVLRADFGPMEIGALRLYVKELYKSQTMARPRQFNIYRPPTQAMQMARMGR